MAVNRIFPAISTNGGTSGSLDSISIAVLTNGDLAIAADNTLNSIHFYRYNSTSSDVEDYPTIIIPDDVVTTGQWELISPSHFMEDLIIEAGNHVLVNEIYGNGSDLQIGYADGTVDITIGNTAISFNKDITTNSQIVSTLAIGTAPFDVTSTTMCPNLNANFVGGTPIADIIVRAGTTQFTGQPQITETGGVPDFTPALDYDLTTKKYVDDRAAGGFTDHGLLGGLGDDDHTQYIRTDGTRAFTGNVIGVTPINTAHLATKGYIDNKITTTSANFIKKDGTILFTANGGVANTAGIPDFNPTLQYHLATKKYVDDELTARDHGLLGGLGDDDHTQYIRTDGTRAFTGVVAGVIPTLSSHLTTKAYVDDKSTAITDVYVVKNGTIPFTGQPAVSNTAGTPDVYPVNQYDLATVEYVDDVVSVGSIAHSALGSLTSPADDHTQYIHTDARRDFTGKVKGLATLGGDHDLTLTTKGYVDGVVISSHSSLSDLTNDDHLQYIRVDGFRVFDTTTAFPGVSNNTFLPDDTPTQPWDLTTKKYVDDGIATLGTAELFDYVDIYGRHTQLSNQGYTTKYDQNPFFSLTDNQLVSKQYVDTYAKGFVVSSSDSYFDSFVNKVETDDAATTTNIYVGTDTGVVVEKTADRLGGIAYVDITDGGDGFFSYKYDDVGYPQTFNTNVFNSSGIGGQSITETQMFPPDDGAGIDGDIRIENVVGDVEYFQIVAQSVSGTIDGDYEFPVVGDTPSSSQAIWSVTVAANVITSVQRISVGSGYSSAYDVTSIAGVSGTFTLRPYVLGTLTKIAVETAGSGYTSPTYNLTEATKAAFTISGEGTSGLLGTLDVTFHNPINEKVKWSHYISDISAVDALTTYGGVGYTRTTGQVIGSLTFDAWGHITGITEQSTGGATWLLVDETDTGLVLDTNTNYFADTTTAAFELRMPVAPILGTTIVIDDYNANSSIFEITVNDSTGANLLVEGSAATPFIIDVNGARVTFTYIDGTFGWRYKVI